jgi:hypothetical protein
VGWHFKVEKEKQLNPLRIIYQSKLFSNNGEIKILPDEQKI